MRAVHNRSRHILQTGGDAGMIVATYQIGNTICKINDALITKTPEEREQADIEIATAAFRCLEERDRRPGSQAGGKRE